MSQDRTHNHRYGGVEAGGTKFVCATGRGSGDLNAIIEIPTREPEPTIRAAVEFFRAQSSSNDGLAGIGIGSFGPLELDRGACDYGHIKTTPKKSWQNVDICGEFSRALDLPVVIDTDVNVAALGESRWGAAKGLRFSLYVTVGTGIGAGAIVEGKILHGAQHPEMGHMLVPMGPDELADFTGTCPYHPSCVESLASGAAVVKRWGSKLCDLPQHHPAWNLEAHYLAAFFSNLTFAFQPQRIISGGGVMSSTLISLVREHLHRNIAGYRLELARRETMDDYLVLPELDGRAGVMGAIAMAKQELNQVATS